MWGAIEKPEMNGKWEEAGWQNWNFRTIKPSGSPLGTVTDDLSVAANGHDFTIDIDTSAFRYIRIKVNNTFIRI